MTNPPHQTLSQIKALLTAHGVRPRHRWGQNFLVDANKLGAILDAAGAGGGDHVLEVGPGTGALTVPLLGAGVNLTAVEIDPVMVAILRDVVGEDREGVFRLIQTDVLASKHALDGEVAAALPGEGVPLKLVANLPYNVASPLLVVLATGCVDLCSAVVMIQLEVADRIGAGPGTKVYGPLSVMLQSLFEVERVATLPPSCFWPKPKISSAVIKLRRRAEPLTGDSRRLAGLLHTLFSKRRKQIGSILGRDTELPAGIRADQRPEELSVEQLCELAESVDPDRE